MPIRFYLLPIQVVVVSPPTPIRSLLGGFVERLKQLIFRIQAEGDHVYRGPMYLRWRMNPDGIDVRWSMRDYGLIPAGLVAADVTPEQHAQLMSHADVTAAPENIDQNIGAAAIPVVQGALEALRIPAEWVTTDHTYRQILRMVGGLFLFAQRYHGMHNEALIDSPSQLDLRWNQIPLARRERIIATADALGYDYAEVTGTWLVRRILKHLGDQWGETPILFGFVTL